MYVIDIDGAGKGTYQKVKKLLKDHGVFSPANCTYEAKQFRFTAPLANGSGRTSEEQLKLIKVELANQCTLSVSVTSDAEPEPEAEPLRGEIDKINKNLGQAVKLFSSLQRQVDALKEPKGDEVTSPEDLLELIEDLTESVGDLASQIESQERGVTAMMNAMTVILTDLGVALDDSASPQGKKAAKERFFHVLRVMQLQMHQAQQAADESEEEADEN